MSQEMEREFCRRMEGIPIPDRRNSEMGNYVWGISAELKRMLSCCLLMFSIEAWCRCGISIALAIHSFDPVWGLSVW